MTPAGTARLAVAGAHLVGQPLHPALLELGARLLMTTRTAPVYRMVALPPGRDVVATPPRPGLIRDPERGWALEVEIYQLPVTALGTLLLSTAPPLAIGTVSLVDGTDAPGFVCEGYAGHTAPDITSYGSWRRYLAALSNAGYEP